MRLKVVIQFIRLVGVSLGFSILIGQTGASANRQQSVHNNNVGFSVAAEIPKNQIHKQNSFFDLKMASGQQQTLRTVIYNVTNKDIKVRTAIHTAYTNTNGTIEYINPAKSYDQSLKYRVSDLATIQGERTITIPAEGSKTVAIKVKLPKQPVNGVLLGGWYFKRVDDKVTGVTEKSINVKNEYSYVIGLKLSSGKLPIPNLCLGPVKAGLNNYHRSIIVALRNPVARIIPNLKIRTVIINKRHQKVIIKNTKTGVMMAPNTVFKAPMPLGSQQLQPGDYQLQMTVNNQRHHWRFKRDFHISMTAAQKYNHESIDNKGVSMWVLIGIGAISMLVLGLGLGVIVWLWRRQRRSKD
ncbi:cell surface protein [Lactiplantibacillus plantarum]|uniref:DUF916 and DUF3324 domain-containing protein n=1 Tax=Lactiplantibacillus plantarum TaxID=1590 RepID=UPI0007C840D2|nr:DUF916 and DUF3324 domain-containing protein [Lactiplantibacillus plantarum]AYE59068.1 cell surface protein [Lactiplantibacillus plantarum]MCS6157101.1 DUF916 and DUF3324 domain-containing protein [Lactiplantibacillus plantarum]NLS61335.1 DUF3324 domain-containing protein [Lactiplantibacillus plantarum]QBJ56737.1 DUF916 and DUF3324 domain-containing protein [Lactiplantibacillus plantarum]